MDAGTLDAGTQIPPAFSPCGLPSSPREDHPPRNTQQKPLGQASSRPDKASFPIASSILAAGSVGREDSWGSPSLLDRCPEGREDGWLD